MNRRKFLGGAAAVGAAAAIAGVSAETTASGQSAGRNKEKATALPPGAPNVLIFMPDQQNGATVLLGSPALRPNLDRFRQEAVTFNSAYCPAPHCCPSRTSFLTGLYPSEHGVYNNVTTDTAIHPNPVPGTEYWAQWMRDAGYTMGYAGKLHVGRDVTPETCGFENWSALEQDHLQSNQARKPEQWQRARQEKSDPAGRRDGEILRPDWTNLQLYKTLPDKGEKGYEGLTDYHVVQAGIAGIKRAAAAGKPWCAMISNGGAHDPYNVPKKFVDMYDPAKIGLPASYSDLLEDKPRVYQRQRYEYWSQLSDAESRDALRHYYAKCTMQDAMFGEILAALEETGQAATTIVIYVSDHGDYHAAHGLWMKGVPSFREAYHIPAIIRWPQGISHPGRQVDAFVEQVDWGPTLLEACGIPAKKKLSGASLMPWLKGETPANWRNAVFSQMNGVELYYTQRIVMTKDWKYVYNGFDYDELYDLRNDPLEMRNLAFPHHEEKQAQIRAGKGLPKNGKIPWPQLTPEGEAARRDLLRQMWSFAAEHHDIITNSYGTVALAPIGPALAIGK